MKHLLTKGMMVIFCMAVIGFSCEKEDEEPNDCYTCTECTGQYAHLLNDREYCVADFDNRSDWQANKTTMEEDNSCTCE